MHAVARVADDRPAADAPRPVAAADVRPARRARRRDHGRAAPARRGVRHPGRRQVAHGREPRVATAARRLRRLLRIPLRLRHVHGVARPELLPGDRLQRGAHPLGREPAVQQVLRPRDARWQTPRTSRRSRSPCCRRSTTSGPTTPSTSFAVAPREDAPWFLYHCTRGAHFDNYPLERFLGSSPAKHPYKDTIIELDDIVGRLVAELEATGQLEDTLIFLSSDNGPEMETWPDAAYSPFRSAKGSTWEGGQRVPGIVAWPGMIEADRASDGLFSQMDLFNTILRLAGRRGPHPERSLHRRRRPDVVPARHRAASRTASSSTTGW